MKMERTELEEKIKHHDIIRIERKELERYLELEQLETPLKIAEAVNSYPNAGGELSELSFLYHLPFKEGWEDYHFPKTRRFIKGLPAMRLGLKSCSRCPPTNIFPSANLKVQGKNYPIHIEKDIISVHLIDSETHEKHTSRSWIVGEKISYPAYVDYSSGFLGIHQVYQGILHALIEKQGMKSRVKVEDDKLSTRISIPPSNHPVALPIKEQVHNFLTGAESLISTITDPTLKDKTLEEVIEMFK